MVKENLNSIIKSILKYSNPLQIRIVTNGYLYQEIEEFLNHYISHYDIPLGLKISMDGTEDTHNKIRRDKDSFKNIRRLEAPQYAWNTK